MHVIRLTHPLLETTRPYNYFWGIGWIRIYTHNTRTHPCTPHTQVPLHAHTHTHLHTLAKYSLPVHSTHRNTHTTAGHITHTASLYTHTHTDTHTGTSLHQKLKGHYVHFVFSQNKEEWATVELDPKSTYSFIYSHSYHSCTHIFYTHVHAIVYTLSLTHTHTHTQK